MAAIAKAAAALLAFPACAAAGVHMTSISTAFLLAELPVVVPLLFMSPLSSRNHHKIHRSSCQQLLTPSSPCSTLTSRSTMFLSSTKPLSSINRILIPSSMDISILEPIGNGTFGGVYHARDETSGKCHRAVTRIIHFGIYIYILTLIFIPARRTTTDSKMCQGHHYSRK